MIRSKTNAPPSGKARITSSSGLTHHGEMGAAALYNRLPGEIAESVRDLAYRLYHICDRKGWAEDALDYNTLVSSWSEITRLAASERGRGTQAELALDTD